MRLIGLSENNSGEIDTSKIEIVQNHPACEMSEWRWLLALHDHENSTEIRQGFIKINNTPLNLDVLFKKTNEKTGLVRLKSNEFDNPIMLIVDDIPGTIQFIPLRLCLLHPSLVPETLVPVTEVTNDQLRFIVEKISLTTNSEKVTRDYFGYLEGRFPLKTHQGYGSNDLWVYKHMLADIKNLTIGFLDKRALVIDLLQKAYQQANIHIDVFREFIVYSEKTKDIEIAANCWLKLEACTPDKSIDHVHFEKQRQIFLDRIFRLVYIEP